MTIPNALPINVIGMSIDDLFDEAKAFLDGEPIANEGQAEAVGKLRDMIRDAEKAAADAKKAQRQPYADQVKAIDADWKPLLEKAGLAKDACNKALAPWLEKVDAEQRQAAADARAEADRLAEAARAPVNPTDLQATANREAAIQAAQAAEKHAAQLDKAKPQAAGASRAIGLRTSWRAEITDATAFARWVWANRKAEMDQFLAELAQRECRHGEQRPGVTVHEERKAA